jgi:hypothetical protein
MEVDDVWFDPLDQFTKELDRAPISNGKVEEIVVLREIKVLPFFALDRDDGGAGFAVDLIVIGFERCDKIGIVSSLQASLKHFVCHLLSATRRY